MQLFGYDIKKLKEVLFILYVLVYYQKKAPGLTVKSERLGMCICQKEKNFINLDIILFIPMYTQQARNTFQRLIFSKDDKWKKGVKCAVFKISDVKSTF